MNQPVVNQPPAPANFAPAPATVGCEPQQSAPSHYDLLVLGWGKAGKTLAKKAAKAGLRVAMVEKDPKMYGGTCINVGCLPTKSLVHSATVLRQAAELGFARTWENNQRAYAAAVTYKQQFVSRLNDKNFHLLADEPTVQIVLGEAKFAGPRQVEVVAADGNVSLLSADKIIINTGAVARQLPIPGASESPRVHTATELLDLSDLPKRLLIIGAGFIGLEFASYFANFGSEVHVYQFDDSFLPGEDEIDASAILARLQNQGVKLHFNTGVERFTDEANGVTALVSYIDDNDEDNTRVEHFDQVLIAAGRVPNTADLNLAAAGVELEGSAVKVNELLQTTAPHIWAVGDVKGGPQFTFISLDDSRIIWPQLIGEQSSYDMQERSVYATVTFLDPPFARVGMNEKQAREAGAEYIVKSLPTAGIPKAHVIHETAGHTRIIVAADGTILGATIFHYEAAEEINLLTLAIKKGVKADELRDFIYTHPTFTESLNDILA